jgi:hypothetical protein
MSEEKLIKWEILHPHSHAENSLAGINPGVMAVASFNSQSGDWSARIGTYGSNSLLNQAHRVAKHGTKLPRIVAGAIFGPLVMDLNVVRMKAGAEPYRWRE